MSETGSGADASLALRYARGELEGEDAASFERRLGESQALRETLCQAVGLLQALEGQPFAGPDRAYRERVRSRLRSQRSRGPTQARLFRHPALWALLGATAGGLLLCLLPPQLSPCPSCAHRRPVKKQAPPSSPRTVDGVPRETTQKGPKEDSRLVQHEQDSSLDSGAPMLRH